MNIHIAFGKDICFTLWEDDFAKTIELATEGNGDIISLNLEKINSKDIANLLDVAQSTKNWRFVTEEQIKIIKKLENNIQYDTEYNNNVSSFKSR